MWRKRLLSVLFVSLVAGCTSPVGILPSPPPPTTTPLRGRITFAGSTTIQPLADKLGKVFQEHHPEVVLDIAAGGSVVGIQAVHDGTADIGMSSRALKPEEAEGISQNQIAIDVLAIIVNPANPVTGLT